MAGDGEKPSEVTWATLSRGAKAVLVALILLLVTPVVWFAAHMIYFVWYIAVDCTVYAPGYDEAKFQAVEIGDSIEDVMVSLGPPYRVVPPYTEGWEYDGWTVYFNEAGTVEVRQLYQWDQEEIAEFMGTLPAGVTAAMVSGKTREEMQATHGPPHRTIHSDGMMDNQRFFFYTHPSSGGMWTDRTWKKRMLWIDLTTGRVTQKHSFWIKAGDPAA